MDRAEKLGLGAGRSGCPFGLDFWEFDMGLLRKLERWGRLTCQGRGVTKVSGQERAVTGQAGPSSDSILLTRIWPFLSHTCVSPPPLCTHPLTLLQPQWPFCCPQGTGPAVSLCMHSSHVWTLCPMWSREPHPAAGLSSCPCHVMCQVSLSCCVSCITVMPLSSTCRFVSVCDTVDWLLGCALSRPIGASLP